MTRARAKKETPLTPHPRLASTSAMDSPPEPTVLKALPHQPSAISHAFRCAAYQEWQHVGIEGESVQSFCFQAKAALLTIDATNLSWTYDEAMQAQQLVAFIKWQLLDFGIMDAATFCAAYKDVVWRMETFGVGVNEDIKVYHLLLKIAPRYPDFAAIVWAVLVMVNPNQPFSKLDEFIGYILDEEKRHAAGPVGTFWWTRNGRIQQ